MTWKPKTYHPKHQSSIILAGWMFSSGSIVSKPQEKLQEICRYTASDHVLGGMIAHNYPRHPKKICCEKVTLQLN